MSDNRPRGKGSKGPYSKTIPDIPLPEYINLPDGRQFKVATLVNKQKGTKNHNLLKLREIPPPPRVLSETSTDKRVRYTYEEKLWMSKVSAEQISKRYNMSIPSARVYKSRMMKAMKFEKTDAGYIIDYTKST